MGFDYGKQNSSQTIAFHLPRASLRDFSLLIILDMSSLNHKRTRSSLSPPVFLSIQKIGN
jgi:hypothetical protein